MAADYDVFFSHAWADGERPPKIADALIQAGLRVWLDAVEIDDFGSITHAVTEGLAKSKALVAYYSKSYPLRRACQWELTAAFLAAQTEGDPRRRVLVINPEKKPENPNPSEHIHPIELRDAKFFQAPTTDEEMRELVEAIVRQVGELSTPMADIHPLTAPNWYGMRGVGSTHFVGRLKEMWELHSLLHAGDAVQITGTAAASGGIAQVQGLGGTGKSLLAEEYALHFGAAYPGGVFWLRAYGNDDAKGAFGATEREALRTDQVRAMAQQFGIETLGLTAEQIEGALVRKVAAEGRSCLWVVDDVPDGLDGEGLRVWFAPHALARTLLTTRSREYGSLANGIDLSVLTPDEAFQLLTAQRKPEGRNEQEQARELTKDLGYHALALDVTASALLSSASTEPFSDFRVKLAWPDKDTMELAKTLAAALPNGHEKSIAQTMLRSITALGKDARDRGEIRDAEAGLDFLRLASVLAVAPIPAPLVTAVFEQVDKLSHEDAEWRTSLAFKQVTLASLADVAVENKGARTVHTLVSRAVRFHEEFSPERTQSLRAAAVVGLSAEIAKAAKDPRLHKQIEFQVAHARQVVLLPTTIQESGLLGWLGEYDNVRGAYWSARTLIGHELEFRYRVQGPEDPDTLRATSNLALTMKDQGDLTGARRLSEETLAIRRKVLGPERPDTLKSMNQVAEMDRLQGHLPEARKLQEETLAISRRVLGSENADTLASMNNLALTMKAQGDLEDARKLNEETLAIRTRFPGPEHPDTLTSMNNLGATLSALGDHAGARKLKEETLAIQRRVLGAEHPDTLRSMSNLALTMTAQEDLTGARKLNEETLALRRKVLGPEHPDTVTSLNNLAATMKAQGDLKGARELYEEALGIRSRVQGVEHPETSICAWNLFRVLKDLSDAAAARALLEHNLLWLLDRDPDIFGADQRKIRTEVRAIGRGWPGLRS
jgi:tetratricopeptide (TPR) repeat protein